jgi:hypothetical protein
MMCGVEHAVYQVSQTRSMDSQGIQIEVLIQSVSKRALQL